MERQNARAYFPHTIHVRIIYNDFSSPQSPHSMLVDFHTLQLHFFAIKVSITNIEWGNGGENVGYNGKTSIVPLILAKIVDNILRG